MRKYYIDNLRSFFILLLIPYHAAMAWNTWGEPNYIFFEGNRLLSSIVVFLSPYFMPILFLTAGISTNYALQKRSIAQYVSERSKRLFIPFVFGTLLALPPQTFLADKFNYGYNGSLFNHYRIFFTKFTDLTGADGGFSVGQFWFVLYLFLISLVAAAIISAQKKLMPKCKTDIPFWGICLLGLPLFFLSEILSVGGKSLAEYTYIFLIGYYVFSNESAICKAEKYKLFSLFIGVISAFLNVYLFIWSDAQYPLFNTVAKFVAEWFMILALLGFGKRYLDFSGNVSKYLSQRSFAFYFWHFIWVVLFQYLLFGILGNNTFLLYAVPVALSYITTLLCCELSVRIPILCFLTGTKNVHKNT